MSITFVGTVKPDDTQPSDSLKPADALSENYGTASCLCSYFSSYLMMKLTVFFILNYYSDKTAFIACGEGFKCELR